MNLLQQKFLENLLQQKLLDGEVILTESEQEKQAFFLACDKIGVSPDACKRAIIQLSYLSSENDFCFVFQCRMLKWGRLSDIQNMSDLRDKIVKWKSISAIMSGQPVFKY